MKIRKILWPLAIFAMFICTDLAAQQIQPEPANFDRFINQVYTNSGKEQIAPTTRRYAFMQHFFNNRISYVVYDPEKLQVLNYTKLSQIQLFDTYNKGLQRDSSFNPETFNPFKYRLGFYGNKKQFVHVDNTNYVIVIEPQS